MAYIQVESISKKYVKGNVETRVLKDVSFQVGKGEFWIIAGPSGSGKSTLLSILGSLNEPDSGRVLVDDLDLFSLSHDERALFRLNYLGFIFQNFHLLPYLTAVENVLLPTLAYPRKISKEKEARELLKMLGLEGKEEKYPKELSGGEQERVAIARALIMEPEILLADEPTGNLDSKTGEEVMKIFAELNRRGKTIIMVTHNLDHLHYATHALFLKDGEVLETKTLKEAN
ncbi:ABC transporter ATP-binding protein [Carboxydothermus hydrogenoformans]|uniref:ABC transporter, ATP-binding protein n=1 Tax=Carboxydothermus hydrogenoformans (strain ATCC BAA-161 / DSM 6008 / Z-2901) TaxID=246194 RepID=Q3AAC0_CARHZ|nr:ABC transporter ATP-binding protein [Carboxydothermus hydrogenoformans]ABB14150.1 ABC transporter, ATP-binding protein [Carboxydothermus hydrogenoformans Z-2901]